MLKIIMIWFYTCKIFLKQAEQQNYGLKILCVLCFYLMMQFVRAEREGDWALHLLVVKGMMPYFFAANHNNYARYGLFYLCSMEKLPEDLVARFLNGEHVMRNKAGLWNWIWLHMFIESTFMRYGHGPGGIIGITLQPSTMTQWALSLHICSQLLNSLQNMRVWN